MAKRSKIIMVYPELGFSGAFVLHPPLGLLYASIEIVKSGIEVEILDTRLYPHSWQSKLKQMVTEDVLLVGISVMSGTPIKKAVAIGHFIKSLDPEIKIVWGGPHATFFSRSILRNKWYCDYVISGYAIRSFYELAQSLLNHREPNTVKGVSFNGKSGLIQIPPDNTRFEFYNYSEIPYQLIGDYSPYGQLDQDKRIFSIYSAIGCPYQCSFCSAPAQYRKIHGKKWIPLPINEIADHIELLIQRYNANYIYFIDDDSFVDIGHVEGILDEIKRRDINIELGFRGARINEIKKMDSVFLHKLARGGTDILHIGAESGSDRILKLLRKNCTVDEIIDANKKLSRHPKIIAAYNFMIGLPTETLSDIKATRDLILRLVKDNPRCIIFQPGRYRPLPATELFEIAQKKYGYKMPNTLKEWSNIETEGDFYMPWYTKRTKRFGDMLFITSYFIDNKVEKTTQGKTLFYKFLRLINLLYTPIAHLRMKYGVYQILIELPLYRFATKVIQNTVPRKVTKLRDLDSIIKIFPEDKLKEKRIKRIQKARALVTEEENGKIKGVAYVNHVWGILPNITWITRKEYRNQDIATKLARQIQTNYHLLTAKTRNAASSQVAKKAGFKKILGNYWIWLNIMLK